MTASDVYKRIETYADATSAPVLSPGDIRVLVEACRRADSAGNAPGEAGWVPTYRVASAVAEAWRLKAGRAATLASLKTPDIEQDWGAVQKNCLAQAQEWQKKVAGSVPVFPRRQRYYEDYVTEPELA